MHVRGRKKMEKYFPHEVPDLRFVLSFIDVIESEKEKASKDESIYKIGVNSCPKLHEPQHCRIGVDKSIFSSFFEIGDFWRPLI